MTIAQDRGKSAQDRLAALGQMRVWSLIVTVFGDAILPRGGTAPSAALAELTSALGIKPEAFRVALSRLTKDGWILRTRSGRHSFYRLSPRGMAEFGAAGGRIYARAPGHVDAWSLVHVPEGVPPAGFVDMGGRLWLGPAGAGVCPTGALAVNGTLAALPPWARARMASDDLVAGYRALLAALGASAAEFEATVDPLRAAVLRTLVVHQWRRLVLRHGDWPPEVFLDDWPGEDARSAVHRALDMLREPSDAWFDAAV